VKGRFVGRASPATAGGRVDFWMVELDKISGSVKNFGSSDFCVGKPSEVTDLGYK